MISISKISVLLSILLFTFTLNAYCGDRENEKYQEPSKNILQAIKLYKSDKSEEEKRPSFKFFLDNAGINVQALYYMGLITYNGEFGIPKNEILGLQMIQKASNSNYDPALIFLALENIKQEEMERKQAGLQTLISDKFDRDKDVLFILGDLYEQGKYVQQSIFDAEKFFYRSARLGNAEAGFRIGVLFIKSQNQAKIDEGWVLIEQAAKNKNGNACRIILTKYKKEQMGPQKISKYLDFLRCAANDGDSESARELGSYYLTGKYVNNDPEQAYKYFNIYLKNNNKEITPDLYFQIGILSVQTNNKENALETLKKASDGEVYNASYYLGRLYESNYWNSKDTYESAKYYYELAGKQGREDIDVDLKRIEEKINLNSTSKKDTMVYNK